MEISDATERLAALAHPARLALFRLLVAAEPDGLAAGRIAEARAAPPNTLSAQLSTLRRAGLIRSRREGRSIIYSADMAAMGALLSYLTDDCCGGRPEACGPLGLAERRPGGAS